MCAVDLRLEKVVMEVETELETGFSSDCKTATPGLLEEVCLVSARAAVETGGNLGKMYQWKTNIYGVRLYFNQHP